MAHKWSETENIFDDYLISIGGIAETEKGTEKTLKNINAIKSLSKIFYIGKTGDPKQRMNGGPALEINENEEVFNEGRHIDSGYKTMWLLLHSANKKSIEAAEETLIEKFFGKDEKNRNKTIKSKGVMKDSGNYFIYVVTD